MFHSEQSGEKTDKGGQEKSETVKGRSGLLEGGKMPCGYCGNEGQLG